jgi:FlgD Ig-like domain
VITTSTPRFARAGWATSSLAALVLLASLLPATPSSAEEKAKPAGDAASPAQVGGCPDDALEPNDVCASASPVGLGTYSGLLLISGNDDWYRISLQRNGTITITLTFVHANGDIDLKLQDGCLGSIVGSSTSITNTETITYKNIGATREFDIRAFLFSGSCNSYTMNIAITSTLDLVASDVPAGWTTPVVVRDDAAATMGSATSSANLVGNAPMTWESVVSRDVSPENTPQWTSALFLDDSLFNDPYIPENFPASFWYSVNHGPSIVRGGRHTFESSVDPEDAVVETNEANNEWSSQWVWSPLVTSYAVPNARYLPPSRGAGVNPNSDGLSWTRQVGVAWVVSEAPVNVSDDYDLVVYNNYLGSTSGFSTVIGGSARSSNQTDYVVGHFSGTPTTVYPAITRFSAGGGGGPFAADQSDARARNGNLNTTPAFSWKPITLAANRLTDVYEAFMTSGLTYYFSLRQLSGTAPITFEIFPGSSGGIYGRGAGTSPGLIGTTQTLAYVPSVTGWHPIVVSRTNGTGAGSSLSYDFEWSTVNFVSVPGGGMGASLAFAGSAPNPIHDEGRFAFALPAAGRAQLGIFDLHGRLVRTLVDGEMSAGDHSVDWDARETSGARVAAGIYWARLQAGEKLLVRRVAVLP